MCIYIYVSIINKSDHELVGKQDKNIWKGLKGEREGRNDKIIL